MDSNGLVNPKYGFHPVVAVVLVSLSGYSISFSWFICSRSLTAIIPLKFAILLEFLCQLHFDDFWGFYG